MGAFFFKVNYEILKIIKILWKYHNDMEKSTEEFLETIYPFSKEQQESWFPKKETLKDSIN